jgi:hypothetical protein
MPGKRAWHRYAICFDAAHQTATFVECGGLAAAVQRDNILRVGYPAMIV